MLSLDMRMVGLHVLPRDSPAQPAPRPDHLNLMTTYSPVTPVELKFMFDDEADILPKPALGPCPPNGSDCDELRSGSVDLVDFAHDLPALSVGDSCSDAHSPAASWTDDSFARTSPDPPAYEVAAREWDQFGFSFAAPLPKKGDEWAEIGNSVATCPSQHSAMGPEKAIFVPGEVIQEDAIEEERANFAYAAGVASLDDDVHVGLNTRPSELDDSGSAAHAMHASTRVLGATPPFVTAVAPGGYAPVSTAALVGYAGGRPSQLASFERPPSNSHLPSSAPGFQTGPVSHIGLHHVEYQHAGSYPQVGQQVAGVSTTGNPPSHVFHLPYSPVQLAQTHQYQHYPLASQPCYSAGAAQGYVPVQFTTVTGATYAVAIPVSATQQTAAIDTPHGTYFFVPTPTQNMSPGTIVQPPPLPLDFMSPPPTPQGGLPVLPKDSPALAPLSWQPETKSPSREQVDESRARAPAKPRSSAKPQAVKAPKVRAKAVKPEQSPEVEAKPERIEPAKSSSFQLPQGPSAAAIAAENAAKAAALVAALGPAHKIRLPVGQGKRGSTKRKYEAANKKDASRRFTCPHPGCGRGFARNFNMQSHYKSHLGVREYDCLWCTKRFSRRHDRARHCVTVHDAVVDRDGTITGPHPVMERNKGKTSIKLDDAAFSRHHADGEFDLDHLPDADVAGSPEERDPGDRRQSASASPYLG
ncbi:hypothetical protein JCM3774_003468 [Rhodotorula dairenensis]